MKNLAAILLLFTQISVILAQNSIRGKVTEDRSKESLLGVNVFIPELQKGSVTDADGYYQINGIPNGHFKVQFSFIGFETAIKTIDIKDCDFVVNLVMKPAAIESQEVIITGGKASTQHENAIKIEQVKKTYLDNAPQTNLIAKLKCMPGIDAITKGNGIASPVIRGLSTSNIVLLNNGVKMENFQFSANHPYIIEENDLSRVEVIKGPASLLYGSDAMGGVINLIKSPPAPVNTLERNILSEYHSNFEGFSNRISLKSSRENIFGGFSIYQNTAKDYTAGNESTVPNSRNSGYGYSLNSGVRFKNGLLKLSYDFGKMTPGLTLPQAINLVETNEYENKVWYQDLDNHLITINNTFFYNKVKLNLDLSYQFNHRKLQTSDLTPSFTMVDMGLQSVTWQIKTKYHYSEKSNYIFSYQGLYQTNQNNNAPEHVLPDFSTINNSLAVLWQYNMRQNIYYQLGLRYDFKIIDVPEQYKSNDESEILEAYYNDYNNISFSTGITYKASESVLLRGNIASAYRTPSIAELLQDGVHANRFEQGNRNLKSQRNLEGDISLHYHSHNTKIELAGFYNRIFDYIFLSPTSDTTTSGMEIYRYQQGNASIYGVEFEFEWQPLSFFVFRSAYSHLIAVQENGDYLPFIPQDKISNLLKFNTPQKGIFKTIEFALNPVIAFKQNKPQEFETETDSYFILNSYLKTSLNIKNQTLNVGLYLNNALNTAYIDHLSTLKELNYYNMGRNISFKLIIPFNSKYRE